MTTFPKLADLLALPLRLEDGDMLDANGNTPDEGKSEPECIEMVRGIIRAVNAFDDMLAALRAVVKRGPPYGGMMITTLDQCKAAIAKAEERT